MARLSPVWPPRVGRMASGRSLADHRGHRLPVEGLDVGAVGEVGVGHDRGRVGVDQDDPVALLLEDPAGLGARVVELARLPDHDRPRPDEQDRLDVGALRHLRRSLRHQPAEVVEEVPRVVGAGSGLGVVLDAERPHVAAAQALDDPVVEVDVGDVGARHRPSAHGVGVVLAGDLDRPVPQPLHRVVAAVVAEGELERRPAQGRRHQLVAEADAEDGDVGRQQVADGLDGVGDGGRVAGAVGEEHPVRVALDDGPGAAWTRGRPPPWPAPTACAGSTS